jgi:uncharacterized protein YqhQ
MPQGEYLQYGGQAIIEGVMMRSPRYFSVACRAPNGEIVTQTEALEKTWIGRQKWLKLPFLRGSLALLDAMALGIKSMRFASNVQMDPQYQPEGAEEPQKAPSKRVQDMAVAGTMVFGILLGLFLFTYLPNLIAEQLRFAGVTSGRLINFTTEIIKIVFFLSYIMLIGQMKDIKELFKYHGAEHKAINALEAERPLEMEECRAQTRLHPRCGTSFAIVVLLVSLVCFTFVPRYPITGEQGASPILDVSVRFVLELMILPLIAGLAYELIRIAGKFRSTTLVNTLFYPGLMSQYLTTREPDDAQIEVALTALRNCVAAERGDAGSQPEGGNELESAPVPLIGS